MPIYKMQGRAMARPCLMIGGGGEEVVLLFEKKRRGRLFDHHHLFCSGIAHLDHVLYGK